MNILIHGANYYEYCQATFVNGAKTLSHDCFNFNPNYNNYTKPYRGQDISFYIDFYPGHMSPPDIDVPKILVWTYDADDGPQPFNPNKFPQFDLYFIRELKSNFGDKVYPMNYGIEDRYYCITEKEDKPFSERSVNCSFYGSFGGANTLMGKREQKLDFIEHNLTKWKPVIGRQWAYKSDPDPYWSEWVNGRFSHDTSYFKALADSKIILSPSGGGSEGGRHYEAIAAHSLPLIEKSHNINIYPHWEDMFPEIVWDKVEECVSKVDYYLSNLEEAQVLADKIFEFGKKNLRSINRAQYILDRMKEHSLL